MAASIAQPDGSCESFRMKIARHGVEDWLMRQTPCVAPFTKDCVLVTEDHDGITITHL